VNSQVTTLQLVRMPRGRVTDKRIVTQDEEKMSMLKVKKVSTDEERTYTLVEAYGERDIVIRLVLKQTEDRMSWFSLYQLAKARSMNKTLQLDEDKIAKAKFQSYLDLVAFIEGLLVNMGYEFMRHPNFDDLILTVPLEYLLTSAEFVVSLLLLEYAWDRSIEAFQLKLPGDTPFKIVVPDVTFEPGPDKAEQQDVEKDLKREREMSDVQMHTVSQLVEDIKDVKIKPEGTVQSMHSVELGGGNDKARLVKMIEKSVEDGTMSLSFALQLLANNEKITLDVPEKAAPETVPRRPTRADSVGNDTMYSGMTGFAPSQRMGPSVFHSVQIKTFDGKSRQIEDAKQWMAQFKYYAELSQWSPEQRLDSFKIHLAGVARYWFKQLPGEVKGDWSSLLQAFKRQYCESNESKRRNYYTLRQKSEESLLEYLHRLNSKAQEAGLDYNNYFPDQKEHLQQYYDTLKDKQVAQQLRMRACESVRTLEEVLLTMDTAGRKGGVPSNPQMKSKSQSNLSHPKSTVSVNAVQAEPESEARTARSDLHCDHCDKTGHTRERCFKLMDCRSCGKKGHTLAHCFKHANEVIARAQAAGKRSVSFADGGSQENE